jgi:hypothetical protein
MLRPFLSSGFWRLPFLDLVVHLLAVDGNIFGSGNPDAHVIALGSKDRYCDVITDENSLIRSSGQYQHLLSFAALGA